MMNYLRKRMKVFLWIIVITFVGGIFLMQYTARRFSNEAAEVNGVKIPYETYKQQLQQRLQSSRSENPEEELKDEDVKRIKQDVISYLILEELLWQEAGKYNLKISDKELAATIRSFPQFQKEGQFYNEIYMQTLKYAFRTTPDKYEKRIRKILITEKMKRLVFSGIKITSREIEHERFRRNTEKPEEGEEDTLPGTVMQSKMMLLRNRWFNNIYKDAKITNNLQRIEKLGF